MGYGFAFKCKNCNKEYMVCFGSNRSGLERYAKLMKDISKGKYGEGLRGEVASNKYAAIDHGKFLYVCDNCLNWENGFDLTTYVPKDESIIENEPIIQRAHEICGYYQYWDGEYKVLNPL